MGVIMRGMGRQKKALPDLKSEMRGAPPALNPQNPDPGQGQTIPGHGSCARHSSKKKKTRPGRGRGSLAWFFFFGAMESAAAMPRYCVALHWVGI